MQPQKLESFEPLEEDGFHLRRSSLTEKVYFYGVGTLAYSLFLYIGVCLPHLAKQFPGRNLDTQLYFYCNMAALTYPFIFHLIKDFSLKTQGDICIVVSSGTVFIIGSIAMWFPESTVAYYLIVPIGHLSFCFGLIRQSLGGKEVTFASSDLIPYLYSSICSSFVLLTMFGLFLESVKVSLKSYLFWQMVPIAVLMVVTLALHSQISESAAYQKGASKFDEKIDRLPIREIWQSWCKIIFETTMLVCFFSFLSLIFPSFIQRLNPSSFSRSEWNNTLQMIGYSSFFIGSLVSSKWFRLKTWHLFIALTFSVLYTVFICNQFLHASPESNDRYWLVVAAGCVTINFLTGMALDLLSDRVLSNPQDSYAAYLISGAISLGYFFGTIGTYYIGELRPE